jgi:hypothetical protein
MRCNSWWLVVIRIAIRWNRHSAFRLCGPARTWTQKIDTCSWRRGVRGRRRSRRWPRCSAATRSSSTCSAMATTRGATSRSGRSTASSQRMRQRAESKRHLPIKYWAWVVLLISARAPQLRSVGCGGFFATRVRDVDVIGREPSVFRSAPIKSRIPPGMADRSQALERGP